MSGKNPAGDDKSAATVVAYDSEDSLEPLKPVQNTSNNPSIFTTGNGRVQQPKQQTSNQNIGGSSQQQSYSAQSSSIQAQIRSIQAQINTLVQAQSAKQTSSGR